MILALPNFHGISHLPGLGRKNVRARSATIKQPFEIFLNNDMIYHYRTEGGKMLSKRWTLNQVPPGERCKVLNVRLHNGVGQRLMEMGMIQGSTVEVIRLAPLGDPMELRLKGYHLSIRKADAAQVDVEQCP
ncbi:MAG: ferrous iron transport protein A [Pseudomonadota bacterium]